MFSHSNRTGKREKFSKVSGKLLRSKKEPALWKPLSDERVRLHGERGADSIADAGALTGITQRSNESYRCFEGGKDGHRAVE